MVKSQNVTTIDCRNSLFRSEDKRTRLVFRVKDIIAIAMPDAALVANKNKTQDLKKIVEKLKKDKIDQAEYFPKEW